MGQPFAIRSRQLRARRVQAGLCGYCGAKRGKRKWLCDACAAKHRAKQRKWEPCPHCKGAGSFPTDGHGEVPCAVCHGDGKMAKDDAADAIIEYGLE